MKGLRNFAVWLLVFGLVGVYSQHHEKSVVDDLEIQEHSNSQKDFENEVSEGSADNVHTRFRRGESVRKAPFPSSRSTRPNNQAGLDQGGRRRTQRINENPNGVNAAAARARAAAAAARGRH